MSRTLLLAVGLVMLMIPSVALSGGDDPILEFDTMFGVTAPFLSSIPNAIRGISGAGAAWRLDQVQGKLESDGDLKIEVEGLVLVSTGQNPQPFFRAAVSCLTINPGPPATVATVNRVTDPFPATVPEGDATIEMNVALPSPCIAPIIFVGTGAGPFRWFSVTGL